MRRQRIEASWARLFREEVLPVLPVYKVQKYYHESKGAPTKELYAMLGLLLLQQMHDLTGEETASQFAYNIQWHYALNITSMDDADAYVSPKTLWIMRSILSEQALYAALFESITDRLAHVFFCQRIQTAYRFSPHLLQHAPPGQDRFVCQGHQVVSGQSQALEQKDLYDGLDRELFDRYMIKHGEAVFSMVKPTESMNTLKILAADVFMLVWQFKNSEQG